MADTDTLIDKIRNTVADVRAHGFMPNHCIVPPRVYDELAPLVPLAAEHFGVDEKRVTLDMLLAFYTTLPE
jgi:hypothetical protein